MKNRNSNIDDLFRQGLQSYTEKPPVEVWDDLQQRLDEDDRRSPFAWWWFIGILLLVMTTGGYIISKNYNTQHKPISGVKISGTTNGMHEQNKSTYHKVVSPIATNTSTTTIHDKESMRSTKKKDETNVISHNEIKNIPTRKHYALNKNNSYYADAVSIHNHQQQKPLRKANNISTINLKRKLTIQSANLHSVIPPATVVPPTLIAVNNAGLPKQSMLQPLSNNYYSSLSTHTSADINISKLPDPTKGILNVDKSDHPQGAITEKKIGSNNLLQKLPKNPKSENLEKQATIPSPTAPDKTSAPKLLQNNIADKTPTGTPTPSSTNKKTANKKTIVQAASSDTVATPLSSPQQQPPVASIKLPKIKQIDFGFKVGVGRGNKAFTATNIVLSPYIQIKESKRFSLLLQPGIKYNTLSSDPFKNDPSQYYNVLHDTMSFIGTASNYNTADPRYNTGLDSFAKYNFTRSFDTVTIKHSTVKSYWEIELPLLLKYYITKNFAVAAGPVFTFGSATMINTSKSYSATTTITGRDSLIAGNSFALSHIDTALHLEPLYSNYNSSYYANDAANTFHWGYMLQISYQYNDKFFFDFSLQQNLSENGFGGNSYMHDLYAQPYLRLSIGYKLYTIHKKITPTP